MVKPKTIKRPVCIRNHNNVVEIEMYIHLSHSVGHGIELGGLWRSPMILVDCFLLSSKNVGRVPGDDDWKIYNCVGMHINQKMVNRIDFFVSLFAFIIYF